MMRSWPAPPSRSTAGISFTRVTGRTYQIVTSTTLANNWVFYADVPAGSGLVTVPHPADSGPRRFYKVIISLAP